MREEREKLISALLAVLHSHQVSLELVAGDPLLPPRSPGYVTLRRLQTNDFKTSPAQFLSEVAQAGSDINNRLTSTDLTFY